MRLSLAVKALIVDQAQRGRVVDEDVVVAAAYRLQRLAQARRPVVQGLGQLQVHARQANMSGDEVQVGDRRGPDDAR